MERRNFAALCAAVLCFWLFALAFGTAQGMGLHLVARREAKTASAQAVWVEPALPAAAAPALSLNCRAAILIEQDSGRVLYEKNAEEKMPIASITKVMTLLLTFEAIHGGRLTLDTLVPVSEHAYHMGGSQIWLKENEQMTVRDLLKAVCIVSGNDAAVALAEHLAGSEDAFVERMNARAQELGMNDTHFVNCTGLPAERHLTSAYDIALMSRELILRHPDIRQFTTVWMDSLRGGESMLVNTNKLIRFYDGATGLKTGSTGSAGYCLSATAEKNGMELIAVVLKGKTSDERFSDAKSLLNYGFSTWSLVTVTPDEVLPPVPVTLGVRGTVQPVLTSENTLLVEKTLANGLTKEVALAESVAAPVYAGDTLGQLTVRDAAGNTVAELPILAGEDVGHVTFVQMLGRCLARGFCMGPRS